MRAEAEAVVRLGAPDAALIETRTAYMRYRGQGHEIAVPLPDAALRRRRRAAMLQPRFEAGYAALFGRIIPGLDVEVMTWTLSLATARPLPARAPAAAAEPRAPAAARHRAACSTRRPAGTSKAAVYRSRRR